MGRTREAGDTTAEWQERSIRTRERELSGMTLNDIRRRDVEPVEGDDEFPMFTMDEELEKRMKLAEAMTRVEKVEDVSLVEDVEDERERERDSSKVDEFREIFLLLSYSR